jgi:hypothetical protein
MTLLRIVFAVGFSCWVAGVGIVAQAQDLGGDLGWKRYSVQQTGTEVDFPAGLFPVDAGPPERGVGRVFESEDGRAKFSAYTLENEADETPRSYLRKHLKVGPAAIDYRRVTGRFFVVSGVRDGEIYYSRCNFRSRMHCIFMSYPERELRAWDRIVTRVSLSLRGPR